MKNAPSNELLHENGLPLIAARIRTSINEQTDDHIKQVIGWVKKCAETEKEGLTHVKEFFFAGKEPLPDLFSSDWSKTNWY